jgi:hypothetical protein
MKVMCIYDSFAHDTSPQYGEVCTVSRLYYNHEMPDGIGAYNFEEHPQPHPYRFGAWRRGMKPGSLEPNFIEIEEEEFEESEVDVAEFIDQFIG